MLVPNFSGLPAGIINSNPGVNEAPNCGPGSRQLAREMKARRLGPNAATSQAHSGDARSEWVAAVEAEVAKGATRMEAVKIVEKRLPGLRQRMLDGLNR